MEKKSIEIRVLTHKNGELLMAVSKDLRGLVVHGRSLEELQKKLPGAVKDLLEADGYEVEFVSIDEHEEAPDFGPPAYTAKASLAA